MKVTRPEIKAWTLSIAVYGFLINYCLWVLFGVPFYWFGWPAYGVAYYLVMDFVDFLRQKELK